MTLETRTTYKEKVSLFALYCVVKKRFFVEWCSTCYRYYSRKPLFFLIDVVFFALYALRTPFTVSKRYLQGQDSENIYTYGETPYSTLEYIARECDITDKDTVYELGCGRGKTLFWLASFIGCRCHGIEIIPSFVQRAQRVQSLFSVEKISFCCEDMLEADFSKATVVYLYGTCLDDTFIRSLAKKMRSLPPGARIITVSYPLTGYSDEEMFSLEKTFSASFTWGSTDVYCHRRL
jgi:hypothetical protein